MPISLTVNGSEVAVAADPDTPLLDVLRNHLGLVGTKFGCGLEQCGCCMVLIDGRPEKSCGKAVSTVAGKAGRDDRGARHARPAAPAAAGLSRRAGRAMRLLPAGDHRHREGTARPQPGAEPGTRSRGRSTTISAAAAAMPASCAPSSAPPRRCGRRAADERWTTRAAGAAAAEPRLDQWVGFPEPGKVRISTGRVEIGQGVLTAMRQIAAEELGVDPARIVLQTGDTALTPNEGYTAGSQSIQFGGVALRLVCAEVRETVSRPCRRRVRVRARRSHRARRRDPLSRRADRAGLLVAGRRGRSEPATRPAARAIKKAAEYTVVGQSAARVDLAAKVFGEAAFVHDMTLDGMVHARVVRQPRPGATIAVDRRGRDPPRRQGTGDRDRPRRQFRRDRRRRRDGRRSRGGGGAGACALGRGRAAEPVSGGGALAVAAALARPRGRRAACRSGTRRDAARGELLPG